MKKLALILLFPFSINAQQQFSKTVLCANTEQVIKTLTGKDYEEKPIWMGVDEKDHTFSVFVNKETTAWTIIEFKGRTACVLGAGQESQISQELAKK